MFFLKLLWRVQIALAKLYWRKSMMEIAVMSDSDFMASMDKFQRHPSHFIRALCGVRWCRITWPNDHPQLHEGDSALVWERMRSG